MGLEAASSSSISSQHAHDGRARGANDNMVRYLPSPPSDKREDVVGMAPIAFLQQTKCCICCCCGRANNPMYAASCQKASCGHVGGARCVMRWVH